MMDVLSSRGMNPWIRWLPGLEIMRRYEAAWLPHDIFAGLVLATMLVPVGIAYAEASGLPGIYGLYATIVPLLAYALFGPSRILVLGPDSALAAVALVSFADTSVLSRAYAARIGSPVDPNQEMVGLGAANLATGLFQGFPISSSGSRTPVAEAAGARTQLTNVIGAVAIAFLLLVAPNLLEHLPNAALAAVVIAAAIGLIEVADLKRIYRIQQWEFWLSIVCFVGVAVLGVIPGIGLAIVIAIIEFLWDGWRPHSAVLGRAYGVKGYHDITRLMHVGSRASSYFVGMRLCFSLTLNCSRNASWMQQRNRRPQSRGWSLRPSRLLASMLPQATRWPS
jgi:MFS superfamily sulfate permease-like transporter